MIEIQISNPFYENCDIKCEIEGNVLTFKLKLLKNIGLGLWVQQEIDLLVLVK